LRLPAVSSDPANAYVVLGRLREGVPLAKASAEMNLLHKQLRQEHPDEAVSDTLTTLTLKDNIVGDSRPILLLLLGAVVFVLLIACVNVANLLLARSYYCAWRQPSPVVRATSDGIVAACTSQRCNGGRTRYPLYPFGKDTRPRQHSTFARCCDELSRSGVRHSGFDTQRDFVWAWASRSGDANFSEQNAERRRTSICRQREETPCPRIASRM